MKYTKITIEIAVETIEDLKAKSTNAPLSEEEVFNLIKHAINQGHTVLARQVDGQKFKLKLGEHGELVY